MVMYATKIINSSWKRKIEMLEGMIRLYFDTETNEMYLELYA